MARIDRDKAQVILIGGFLIAIGVVSAILVLNNISYSQTIASHNGNSGDFGPVEFSDNAEVAVSEAMTGNGSNPDGARNHFEAYIESYSDRADEILSEEGVSADASVPNLIGDTTKSWMVGQRQNGTFQNATGGEEWIMAEDISTNHRTRFYLNVDGMNNADDEVFIMNATEDGDFSSDLLNPLLLRDGWRLTMNITTSDELTLNMTDVGSASGLEFSSDSDEVTTDISGNETVVVDVLNQTVNGASSAFPSGTSVNPEDANGFAFEDASNGAGTYDFRFDDTATFRNGGRGPCDHPDQAECRGADGTEKHAVGVVHSITSDAVELSYVGRSISYSKTVGGMVLDADDVNLEEIRKVDNASYFDVNIVADNAPVDEGNIVQIDYEVTNTGTQPDTQNMTLEIPKGDVKDFDDTVTVNPGTTEDPANLTWDTSSTPGDNGSYTAYVISNKSGSVDTTQISIDKSSGPGIPESPVGLALPSPVFETLAEVAQR